MIREVQLAFGLKVFYSKEGLRSYIKDLLDYYQREADKYGEWLGDVIRNPQQQGAEAPKEKDIRKNQKGKGKATSKGWAEMGPMLVNTSDPSGGITEVLLAAFEEVKLKLSRTTESLKALEGIENLGVPDRASYTLYLKEGVPDRLIIDTQHTRPEQFSFSADFQVV